MTVLGGSACSGLSNNYEINKFMPEKDRYIPFEQMIYIGDGETDVPAMKMIKYQGGKAIAVYNSMSFS